jgi:short-subunit dehydrogenase
MSPRKPGTAPTALVTGATSGIGEALAGCFAESGCNVVLVARRAARLRERAEALAAAHGVRAWAMPADLVQPGAVARLAAALRRARRPVDIVVNNAGVLHHGPFAALPAAQQREMVALNVGALTEMLAHFVPPMVARGHGRVLNVASIASFQPVPGLATYAATKAYVLSLTESLAEELRGTGVTVTALCPGLTATHMLSAAQQASPALRRLPGWVVGDAADVAAEGHAACMAGEVIRVPGVVNLAAMLAGRATPRWALRRLVGALAGRLK